MNQLTLARRAAIVRCLVDGVSIRGTSRITGAAKATIMKLFVELGEFCAIYQDHRLRALPCRRIEIDEIWAFCGAKQRNATQVGQGDLWTYTALCADTKLLLGWLVGARSQANADTFVRDIAARVPHRVQLTSDGHGMYLTAVRHAWPSSKVDYAQLVKSYGLAEPAMGPRRYSPMICTGTEKVRIIGRPDMDLVSTSYVERANLTMRMGMRRFTRLTNAFSKKAEHHAFAVALHAMHYNFCRPHRTLTKDHPHHYPTTPAMAAGLATCVWTVDELCALLDPHRLIKAA